LSKPVNPRRAKTSRRNLTTPAALFFFSPAKGTQDAHRLPRHGRSASATAVGKLLMTGSPARRATNRKRLVKEVLGTAIGTIVNSGGFEVVSGTASGTTVGAGRLLVWHHDS